MHVQHAATDESSCAACGSPSLCPRAGAELDRLGRQRRSV